MSGNEALRRELTTWRRIFEHQRAEAKRDLAHAQEQISRIDAEYTRYFASAIETGTAETEGLGPTDESAAPKGDAQGEAA